MADFPEAPVTTVQTIINIATLVMIPAALVTGPIVNKIGYKTTGIIAMVIALVGGVAPAFVHPSVEFMIFERGVFGIGYGMVYTLSIAACGEFWRGKATTGVVGAVNFGARPRGHPVQPVGRGACADGLGSHPLRLLHHRPHRWRTTPS